MLIQACALCAFEMLWMQSVYDKLRTEVPKYKMITVSVLSDRLRINASLARKAINELVEEGQIRKVFEHNKQQVYTRNTNA